MIRAYTGEGGFDKEETGLRTTPGQRATEEPNGFNIRVLDTYPMGDSPSLIHKFIIIFHICDPDKSKEQRYGIRG